MATVSMVLVSHSRQLAEGVRELAAQMTQGKVKIAVAGGTADGRLGTDATAILGAIEEVRGPEGVLVLVDLGSAVLLAHERRFEPVEFFALVKKARALLVDSYEEDSLAEAIANELGHPCPNSCSRGVTPQTPRANSDAQGSTQARAWPSRWTRRGSRSSSRRQPHQ